jgi:phage gpG-like protein
MPTLIRFAFYGDVQLERTIDRTLDALDDASPAWEVIATSFQRAERRQFATEGAYASGGWAPLSPKYAAWKERHYPGQPILVLTGDLKRSLTERPFGIEVIEPQRMRIGSDVEHGAYHQGGGGNLPRRRPVELTESLRRSWVKTIQRWIVTGKAGS